MAQLYKMTLYVCDLEENLSLEEIKRLIKDDALDGISTSCVTHFANEKVGAHVDGKIIYLKRSAFPSLKPEQSIKLSELADLAL